MNDVSSKVWDIVIGELLGDWHIRIWGENGRLEFIFSYKAWSHIKYLKYNALALICTKSEPTPWLNLKVRGKNPR